MVIVNHCLKSTDDTCGVREGDDRHHYWLTPKGTGGQTMVIFNHGIKSTGEWRHMWSEGGGGKAPLLVNSKGDRGLTHYWLTQRG